MAFDAGHLRHELEASGALLVTALRGVDRALTTRHVEPDTWSILEIAAHLLDEERLDFRPRTRSTLEDPTRAWDPIDPESWVARHDYASWDFDDTVGDFERERTRSVEWLATVADADWSRAFEHPEFGPIAAGELLASWVAHDRLHVAQLARTQVELMDAEVTPYSTRYAKP